MNKALSTLVAYYRSGEVEWPEPPHIDEAWKVLEEAMKAQDTIFAKPGVRLSPLTPVRVRFVATMEMVEAKTVIYQGDRHGVEVDLSKAQDIELYYHDGK